MLFGATTKCCTVHAKGKEAIEAFVGYRSVTICLAGFDMPKLVSVDWVCVRSATVES